MRVRSEHWQLLLNLCESNPEIITNKFNGPNGKAKGHALWQTVAQKLNSLGFVEKSKDDWRKALIDWKSKTKAKAAKIRQETMKTGGGEANYTPLSDLEQRLIDLMGLKAIEGGNVHGLGFGNVIQDRASSLSTENLEESAHSVEESTLDRTYCERKVKNTFVCSEIEPVATTSMSNGINSPIQTSCKLKRKFSDSKKSERKSLKRLRPKETERLSHRLLEINEESLNIIRNINQSVDNLADSIKNMAATNELSPNRTRKTKHRTTSTLAGRKKGRFLNKCCR